MCKTGIGVIIGRFQVPTPTHGHNGLFDEAKKHHNTVVALIGCTPSLNRRNMLDYQCRAAMLHSRTGCVTLPLLDQPSDELWTRQIDTLIDSLFPGKSATLYGGRDSCITHYKGKHTFVNVTTVESPSGTEVRERIRYQPINSEDFRAGVIYRAMNDWPRAIPCVDIAVLSRGSDPLNTGLYTHVLMARKATEEAATGYRFIGGHVDAADLSLEQAVRREVYEEAGLEIGNLRYVGSAHINDWRYRNSGDGIMSSLFVADHVWGKGHADDDIESVHWVDLKHFRTEKVAEDIVLPAHRPLAHLLTAFLKEN